MSSAQYVPGFSFKTRPNGNMICTLGKTQPPLNVLLLESLTLLKKEKYPLKQGENEALTLSSVSNFITANFFIFRILGGVTLSPRPNIYCKQNISDLSVCDTEQKEIAIDENYCLSVDHHGKPVDIYSKSQYG